MYPQTPWNVEYSFLLETENDKKPFQWQGSLYLPLSVYLKALFEACIKKQGGKRKMEDREVVKNGRKIGIERGRNQRKEKDEFGLFEAFS